ncbi:MAG: class I SAM-dependent RNA methyltransferase [Tissierellia bacterium]|nr:class I SAM-dependent RNA methyltransferase [Tissierellia bacterium]
MGKYNLHATVAFGLEAITKRELIGLGMENVRVEDGKVRFSGDEYDIAKANLWLRTADRVLLEVGEFKALSFTELFDKTREIPWEEYIPEDGNFTVDGSSVKSKLFSISDSQSIVEKAIVERLKENYKGVDWFEKTGARYKVKVALLRDIATITIDTTGESLHKRGYRKRQAIAPIKETLAAAMVMLSFWKPERPLFDPFCGSGTILVEAALIGKNIAPGLDRSFVAETWDMIDPKVWKEERVKALKEIRNDVKLNLLGSDIDRKLVLIARDNAFNLGLEDDIAFTIKDFRDVDLKDDYGVLITNPPYGERISEIDEAKELYKDLGEKMKDLKTWSIYVITNHEDFEKSYGRKADRKRKLFNGNIKTDYYQFYGERPPRE